ncbi:hypothetical protein EYF80_039150 [Liparis tanakae]|uniref:Uncharacterized protein n=1 Tax=Liparis tanakae TaxID=230148 RepID=A0A4Z2GAM5_9TELE|nr:hypothetical protein EYF80_039150 [Liparis tanakae]
MAPNLESPPFGSLRRPIRRLASPSPRSHGTARAYCNLGKSSERRRADCAPASESSSFGSNLAGLGPGVGPRGRDAPVIARSWRESPARLPRRFGEEVIRIRED